MLDLILKVISGDLPSSEFDLLLDGQRIGMIQIRHRPSASKSFPENFKSHIYYEIDPEYRGSGFGNEILKMGLAEAKKLGLKEVILTCRERNIPSKKVIERNGGVLMASAELSDGLILKYRIGLE